MPTATAFAHRWLYDSIAGIAFVAAMTLMDVAGVDIESVEGARRLRDAWVTFYEKRGGQRERLRKLAKDQGWAGLDETRLMREATLWAKAHHVYGSLRSAVEAEYGGSEPYPDPPVYHDWSKRLRKFDEVLGRPRTPGRWTD